MEVVSGGLSPVGTLPWKSPSLTQGLGGIPSAVPTGPERTSPVGVQNSVQTEVPFKKRLEAESRIEVNKRPEAVKDETRYSS